MTLRRLNHRLAYWKTVLNLNDWQIELSWMSKEDAESCQGMAWWHCEELTAWIHVAKRCKDQEGSLIHELLHILIEGYRPLPISYSVPKERALNKMTAALLSLEHRQ